MTIHELRTALATGLVIPAHPLALTAQRKLDERRQRALTRYYLAASLLKPPKGTKLRKYVPFWA